ncbi:O-antigen ligase family protein [Mesorhizobium sp. NBSH29]|uniref:O-antigen ligase family protein n=1 Tax=Mesorhizobium sp. NBSH29 TaxID=2654249 RepID=UPI00189669BA|nr:O-antigen ligase [Mesorhizobium sp. NBSH29]QPC86779.1 O-antigen ligase family protein [Mesorhizobium sp. NBSH29]
MSNTGSLKRTELDAIRDRFPVRRIGILLTSLIFAVALVGFRPFQLIGDEAMEGGDVVNQLGFGSLGAVSLFSLLAFTDRRVLAALFSPWWLLLLAFLLLSVLHAADPSSAMRAAFFTVIGLLAMVSVLAVPRDADAFSTSLAFAGFAVILLSYAGLIVFPDIARHTANSLEPQHAGFWRGVFQHKNLTGPVMACFSFGGLYLFRRGWKQAGGILFITAIIFMANTGSKTTVGLVPLAVGLVMLPGIIGMRFLTPLLFTVAIVLTGLATIGIVFIPALTDLASTVAPDLTYTGRTALWKFSGEMIMHQPWWGYGYESFWGTPFITEMDRSFDQDWDIRGIVHGHNGYLDIAVIMGLPALAVAAITFLIVPLFDYMRTPNLKENIYLADFFMMILLFTTLNAFLESIFFRRADPVWLFFILAVFGLRVVARIPYRSRPDDTGHQPR